MSMCLDWIVKRQWEVDLRYDPVLLFRAFASGPGISDWLSTSTFLYWTGQVLVSLAEHSVQDGRQE
jgi:hypothetical protein